MVDVHLRVRFPSGNGPIHKILKGFFFLLRIMGPPVLKTKLAFRGEICRRKEILQPPINQGEAFHIKVNIARRSRRKSPQPESWVSVWRQNSEAGDDNFAPLRGEVELLGLDLQSRLFNQTIQYLLV